MRALGLLALALPLLPTMALAQPAAKTKGLADCAALVASVPDIVTSAETTIEDVEGGCRATHIRYAVSDYLHYGAEEVTLLSPDLLRTFPKGEVLAAVDLEIKGARVMPQTSSPLQDYILGLSMAFMDLHLVYTTDAAAKTSEVSFSFGSGPLGRIDVSASLAEFDNADVDLDRLAAVAGAVKRLDVTLDDHGLFAVMFAPPILGTMNPDEDPRPTIMAAQEAIVAALSGLPETTITPDSRVALASLVRAFPKPEGEWTLHFESDTGLPFDRIASGDLVSLVGALANSRIEATGTPAAP